MQGGRETRSHAKSTPAKNNELNYFTCKRSGPTESELPSYECTDCKKMVYSVDSPAVCDFCENKYCFKCSSVSSKEVYQQLGSCKNENEMFWFCRHCRISFSGVKKMLCRVTKLEQTQADFTEMQEKLVKKVDDLENKVDEKIKEALLEQKERENRKLNIMCFGLSESEKETPEDRHNEDCEQLNYIVESVMELENHDSLFTAKPVRIGPRKPVKCRPVHLTIESIERMKKVLEAARTKVRNSDSALVRNVYFHSDLIKTQRNEAYERRERKRLLKAEQENQHRKERDKDRLGDRAESIHGSQ